MLNGLDKKETYLEDYLKETGTTRYLTIALACLRFKRPLKDI